MTQKTNLEQGWRWPFSTAQTIGAGLVVAGLLLSTMNWWWFVLVGVGAFGPGLLRELGILRDKDEFQLEADRRAGFHAFLATGLAATLIFACQRASSMLETSTADLPLLLFTVLWMTWVISALLDFWGPKKTAERVLWFFGVGWLGFVVLANTGNEWLGWGPLLMHLLLVVPFFGVAMVARKFPRAGGFVLILTAIYLFYFLGGFGSSNFNFANRATTYLMFLAPLLVSGIALICSSRTSHQNMPDID